MSFVDELRRRHVFRAALAYLAGSWLLIQVLETLLPIFDIPERSIRAIVIVLGIGFVPALVFAWIFEWTPDGLVRDADAPPAGQRSTSSMFDKAIIAVLAIAVVYFAAERFLVQPGNLTRAETVAREYGRSHRVDDRSIAVLPFSFEGDGERQAHFAGGLTDAIRIALTGVGELRVIAKSSVMPYQDRERTARELGEILGVGRILTGQVLRTQDRIRVTVELTDASNGQLTWADTFDSALSVQNIMDIQDRIASTVAGELELVLAGSNGNRSSAEPASLEALDAYHDGLYYLESLIQNAGLDDEDVAGIAARAADNFEKAINADPDWAPPRAMLGRLLHFRWNATREPDGLAEAKRHLTNALRIDPAFGPARTSYGYVLTKNGEYGAALREYERSISLGSPDAHWGLGILYRYLGRHAEAVAALRQAVSADPLVLPIRFQLAETNYCERNFAASLNDFSEYFELHDGGVPERLLLADLYARTGNPESALDIANGLAIETGREDIIARVLVLTGNSGRARNAVEQSDESSPFIVLDIVPGVILLGDNDRALTMLERATDFGLENLDRREQFDWIWKLRCSPEIQTLEGNPRYEAILRRHGLPD